MGDEELFQQRVTHLSLAKTVATDVTIRDGAPVDLEIDSGSLGPLRTSDLAILSTIGEGGMGRVHLARQRSLDRDVAVKTLKEGATPEAAAGLFHEARLTGSLEHPGVIPVHALGLDATGGPLLVMKRVEGVDWATLLEDPAHAHWALLTAKVDRLAANLEILTQVCRTIEFAHSRGVFHRDIKPENVMVGSYGEVYVVDWGIATTTKVLRPTDGLCGTPAYMAPEMFLGTKIDERTDVYLLGATLHQVLTGTFRHDGELAQVLHSSLLSKPVAYDAGVPEFLGALCNAATAREPDERPANARAFRDQLAEFLHRRSALALSEAATERLEKLRALLRDTTGFAAPADLASAYRFATEARFGFTESLREHPTGTEANDGLRETVASLVDLELRQGHADTAEVLLRELDAPDDSLTARLAEVRAQDAARRRGAQRLEKLDRDLDPTIDARPRAFLIAVLVGISALVSTFAAVTSGRDMTPRSLLYYGTIFAGLMAAGMVRFRKHLFANAYNRKLAWVMVIIVMFVLLQRAISFVANTPPHVTFSNNLWFQAAGIAIGAVAIQRRLWISVPVLVAGAVALEIVTPHAPEIYAATVMTSLVLVIVALWPKNEPAPPRPD